MPKCSQCIHSTYTYPNGNRIQWICKLPDCDITQHCKNSDYYIAEADMDSRYDISRQLEVE